MKKWTTVLLLAGLAGANGCCSDASHGGGDAATPDGGNADTGGADTGGADTGGDAGGSDAGGGDAGGDVGAPDGALDGGDAGVDAGADAADAGDDAADAGDGAVARCPACAGSDCAIVEVTTGARYTCARRASGEVLCWGDNAVGKFGNGTTTGSTRPVPVEGVCDAAEIEAGSAAFCVRHRSGRVSCSGTNISGVLGTGMPPEALVGSTRPLAVAGLDDAVTLEGGAGFFCAVRRGGSVACWGSNNAQQLGVVTAESFRPAPTAVPGLADVVQLGASQYGCAVRSSGQALCWGRNAGLGRLGTGAAGDAPTPTAVPGLTDVIAVGNGIYHGCFLRMGGTVACTGGNAAGELGVAASPAVRLAPEAVPGLTDVTQIAVGHRHTCALRRDGTVVCWGKNNLGELGRGTTSPYEATPAPVPGLTDVVAITAHAPNDGPREGGHTCALRRDGTVLCWGKNDLGQLGDGTTTDRASPTPVTF